jgi:Secretion system C-terminal sorting domain
MKNLIKIWVFCVAIFSQTGFLAQAINTTDISQNGSCDGSATFNYTSAYTNVISWHNTFDNSLVQIGGNTVNNLCSGAYNVYVQDSTNVVDTLQFYIDTFTICNGFYAEIVTSPINNFITCDGQASVDVFGSQAVTYLWHNGATTAVLENFCYESYVSCTVTNEFGCSITVEDSVVAGNPVNSCIGFDIQLISANSDINGCNANASISIYGNSSGVSYLWNTGATTATLFGLCSGYYSCSVTNALGCSLEVATYISDSSIYMDTTYTNDWIDTTSNPCIGFDIQLISANSDINGCNANASISIYGDSSGVSYLWNTGATTATLFGLCSGYYSCSVTNALGCSLEVATYISDSSIYMDTTYTNDWIDTNCAGFDGNIITTEHSNCNSYATVEMLGNQTGLTYLWSNGATTATAYQLCQGVYSCEVTNDLGCTVLLETYVSDSIFGNDSTNCDGFDGNIITTVYSNCNSYATVEMLGNQTGLTYLWSNGATTATVYQLCQGVYSCEVTNDLGCTVLLETYVSDSIFGNDSTAVLETVSEALVNVYPNPFTETLKISLEKTQDVEVQLFDLTGRNVIKESFINVSTVELNNLSTLAKGEYILHIQTATGVVSRKVVK